MHLCILLPTILFSIDSVLNRYCVIQRLNLTCRVNLKYGKSYKYSSLKSTYFF